MYSSQKAETASVQEHVADEHMVGSIPTLEYHTAMNRSKVLVPTAWRAHRDMVFMRDPDAKGHTVQSSRTGNVQR